jgi:DsbC/DsbD-like thiol-disulfide interchange protein
MATAMAAIAAIMIYAAMIYAADNVSAQDASDWVRGDYSALRLLAGSHAGSERVLLGGIEIDLQPGWKTYWRMPGDSGVPPRFDFSRSENVEAAALLWPAPAKFADGAGGYSVGYSGKVLFPLRITAKDPTRPVILRADASYAVCEKLCVPVDATAELAFARSTGGLDGVLTSALATIPAPGQVGDDGPLAIRSVRYDRSKKEVTIAVAAPAEDKVDMFAEGPTPEWSLPLPQERARRPDGSREFAFILDGVPPGADAETATYRLTVVAGSAARELAVKLK